MALNGDSQFSEEEAGMIRGLALIGLVVFMMLFTIGFKFLSDLKEYSVDTL